MSKIDRYDGNFPTFAENFQSQERTAFGTEDVGENGLTENMNQSWQRGWGIISPSEFPPIQYFNAVGFTLSRVLEYLHQTGVPEWDADQEYYQPALTQKGGSLWASQSGTDGSPNVGNDPETDDGTNWVKVPNADEVEGQINDLGVAQSVDSVSDLRASSFPANLKRLWLSGLYGVSSDGGGPYYRNGDGFSASDDDGLKNIVDFDGTRWTLKENIGARKMTDLAPEAHIHVSDRPYTAWPFCNLLYKSSSNFLFQIFSAGSDHLETDGVVYATRMGGVNTPERHFGQNYLVADRESEGFIATCHASAVAPNGDLIAFVRFWDVSDAQDTEVYLYRGTNNGTSWSGEEWLDETSSVIHTGTGAGAPHGMYITRDGTIIVYEWTGSSGAAQIYRSTDPSGANGTYVLQESIDTSNLDGGVPLEGIFAQNPDTGVITVVARRGFGANSNEAALVYSKSSDDGATWSPFELTDVDNANGSPAAIVEHDDNNQVEVFWTDRAPHPYDGYGSIYQNIVSYNDLEQGAIATGARRIGVMSTSNDSGYVAAAKTDSGEVFMSYYAGNDSWTFIPIFSSGAASNNGGGFGKSIVAKQSTLDNYRKHGYKIFADGEAHAWQEVDIDFTTEINTYHLPINFDIEAADNTGGVSVSGTPQESPGDEREAFQKVVYFIEGSAGQNGSIIAGVTDTTVSSGTLKVLLKAEGNIFTDIE